LDEKALKSRHLVETLFFFSRSGGNSPFGFKTGRAWRYGKPTTAFAMSDLQFPEIGRCDFLRALG
jgi:hypothetical protein